jgi:hypothetical protein
LGCASAAQAGLANPALAGCLPSLSHPTHAHQQHIGQAPGVKASVKWPPFIFQSGTIDGASHVAMALLEGAGFLHPSRIQRNSCALNQNHMPFSPRKKPSQPFLVVQVVFIFILGCQTWTPCFDNTSDSSGAFYLFSVNGLAFAAHVICNSEAVGCISRYQ